MSDLWARCLAEFEERANPEGASDDPEVMRWVMAHARSELEARIAVLRDLYAETAARLEYERTKSSFEVSGWKKGLLRELDRRMGW